MRFVQRAACSAHPPRVRAAVRVCVWTHFPRTFFCLHTKARALPGWSLACVVGCGLWGFMY
jgi:hypothetical protein